MTSRQKAGFVIVAVVTLALPWIYESPLTLGLVALAVLLLMLWGLIHDPGNTGR
jgi:hypothetical protein